MATGRTATGCWMLLVLLLGAPACAGGRCRSAGPPPRSVRVQSPSRPTPRTVAPERDPVEVAADAILAQARAAEPETTRHLQRLAEELNGRLIGLEHRLKGRDSTIEKIRRLLEKTPEKRADEIIVYDALRYTLLLPDEPVGHHAEAVRRVLSVMEAHGHVMQKVKNYWPRGDSYSGVNTVIRDSENLLWELQFHTPASYAIKSFTHEDYEVMRKPGTPLEEQRRLFERQSVIWDDIRIPEGILVPGALHDLSEPTTIPAP